ncbi:MAG: helix-turn-helix transcriptional regulator [Clostridia bacterium]|nr:helix-turn-helix transcriptional regulator [Clostridia bacterium]
MSISEECLVHLSADDLATPDGARFDYTCSPRPFSSLAYMESGFAEFWEGEAYHVLREGEVVLIPVGACYRSCWHGSPSRAVSIHFHFSPLAYPYTKGRYAVQVIPGSDSLHAHMRAILSRITVQEESMALLSHAYAMASEAYRRLSYTPVPAIDERLRRAIEYLDSPSMPPISMDELAMQCNLSPSHFYSLFRAALHTSPVEYKNRAAIRHAEQLLLTDRALPIEELATRLGFSSATYFRYVFTRYTGLSPRAYRARGSGL